MEEYILDCKIDQLENELDILYRTREGFTYEERNPTVNARWYNIDIGKHYIVSKCLTNQSNLFCIESKDKVKFLEYYNNNFGINFKYENEILDRLGVFHIDFYINIDPKDKEFKISKKDVNKYKYVNNKFMITSNNKKLFNQVYLMLKINQSYTPRKSFEWYNTEIRKCLPFSPPLIGPKKVLKQNIMGNTVYYSDFHRIWGFTEEQFNYIYTLEVGHLPIYEEVILKRLDKRIYNYYVNLDPSIVKLDHITDLYIHDFKFIDHTLKIVANSKRVFESYRKALNKR